MPRIVSSSALRRVARIALVGSAAVLSARCGESGRYGTGPGTGGSGGTGGTGGGGGTAGAPTVTILQPATNNFPVGVGDSVLVQFRATDNQGVVAIEMVGVAKRGNAAFGTDTVVDRFVKRTLTIPNRPDTTMARFLYVLKTDSTSENALVIVTAIDSAGNRGSDTATVRLTQGPKITVDRPTAGAVSSVGKSITIQITATDPQGVRVVGWRTAGVLARQDSMIVSGAALPTTATFIDTLTIPAGTSAGNLTVTGFGVDSIGDPSGAAAGVTIAVQNVASDVTPPVVNFTIAASARVEVDDSVQVHATDASGISRIGFVIRPVGSAAVVAADSLIFSGNQTDVTGQLRLLLDTISSFPRLLTIEAFAVDSVGNRGLSTFTNTPVGATGVAGKDTVTVVAGKTFSLPSGGQIGDAIYSRNRNELYLSNLVLNRLEVFNVGSFTFLQGGIPVGSRPLGLALWPRDTLGTYGDTVLVANSGGTNVSVVDVLNRVERRRHALPNYLVQTVRTVTDPQSGTLKLNVVEYDFSDRPQYIGTACRANCANVFAVYSTTPTPAQPGALTNRGYLAWEELTAPPATPNGHFFWEHATGSAAIANDTIQVLSLRGNGVTSIELGAGAGIMANLPDIGFRDSTYVRNSGDFNHALIGEGGGEVAFTRALTWDSRSGVITISGQQPLCDSLFAGFPAGTCQGQQDNGVSPGVYVRDFIGNRASRVHSVATNFNGLTNFVRADSIYVFDRNLRLTGLLQISGVNPGMDVHPSNNFDASTRGSGGFGGSGSPNNRLVYAARPDASIDVFDTYWFGSVANIPVRDPIIGPVRLALNAGGQQVLVGVTKNGVVVVPLTAIVNPFPTGAQPAQSRR